MPIGDTEASGERDDLATIIGLYALGEITLGTAASRYGVSRIEMKRILGEAGVSLRLGPKNADEAAAEVQTLIDANE